MLIDNLHVFTDNEAVKSGVPSKTIAIAPFLGKATPVSLTLVVTGKYPASANISVAIQASEDGVSFTQAASVDVPKETLTRGGSVSFALPAGIKGPFVRLMYTVAGTPASGKIWAGLTRDSLEALGKGEYANAGKVEQ